MKVRCPLKVSLFSHENKDSLFRHKKVKEDSSLLIETNCILKQIRGYGVMTEVS